jgi:hypothetical protein
MGAVTTHASTSARVSTTKILVAVHGIGDQIGYETIQSVATRIGAYYGIATALPLGRFYPATSGPTTGGSASSAPAAGGPATSGPIKPGPALMMSPPDPVEFTDLGFAEVYWAGITREVSQDKYILEESKKWARTIMARMAQRSASHGTSIPRRAHDRIVTVLDEMIETVFVLERLTFVADRAGLFKFNLKDVLADFLGDVQIVSEFVAYRNRILAEFDSVMNAALALKANTTETELYLVAHSEGSAVAFLAVLTALADPGSHQWIKSVRGLMTIGSPIETHHLLWPNLWTDLRPDHAGIQRICGNDFRIQWRNYFDYGDPIAYALTKTKEWLEPSGFRQYLTFEETGFSRSYVPGKAHIDYWKDDEVFGHFIEHVIKPSRPRGSTARRFTDAPRSKRRAVFVSYVIPPLLIAVMLLAATYSLYRPVVAALNPGMDYPASSILRDVVGIGLLLLGITAAARIPRLTDKWRWWALSGGFLLACMLAYATVTCGSTRQALGGYFDDKLSVPGWLQVIPVPLRECTPGNPVDPPKTDVNAPQTQAVPTAPQPSSQVSRTSLIDAPTLGLLLVAAIVVVICGFAASWGPFFGARAADLRRSRRGRPHRLAAESNSR